MLMTSIAGVCGVFLTGLVSGIWVFAALAAFAERASADEVR